MFTRLSIKATAAALLLLPLAAPAPLAAQQAQFRGGGHISNFQNCPGWGPNSTSVTARSTINGDVHTYSIFAPSIAVGYRDFGEPDGNGWQTVQQTSIFGTTFVNTVQIRVMSVFPPDPDAGTESYNIRGEVRGFSGYEDCTVEIRLMLRRQES